MRSQKKREKGTENLFEEIMTSLSWGRKTSLSWGRKQTSRYRKNRVPNKMNPKRSTLRHFIIKMAKVRDKERILKAVREKQLITY